YRELFFRTQDYDLWLRFVEKFEASNLSIPLYKKRFNRHSLISQKIVSRRIGKFARKLASARKKGISEASLIKELKDYLKSPLSVAEKNEIIKIHVHWVRLLLRKSNPDEAFTLMDEVFKYYPSGLFKFLFQVIVHFRSLILLEIFLRIWFFITFNWKM
ncbi:MAG: hypothetical protein ACFFCQ_18920, partial [Promethearchaeota archaeon]